MVKRIPSQSITTNSPIVLPKGHPDLLFLNPNNVLIKEADATVYKKYLSSAVGDPGNGTPPPGATPPAAVPVVPVTLDVPSLTDIENISQTQYYDTASKLAKITVVLKVRNSSKSIKKVVGVDARIYNPNA